MGVREKRSVRRRNEQKWGGPHTPEEGLKCRTLLKSRPELIDLEGQAFSKRKRKNKRKKVNSCDKSKGHKNRRQNPDPGTKVSEENLMKHVGLCF